MGYTSVFRGTHSSEHVVDLVEHCIYEGGLQRVAWVVSGHLPDIAQDASGLHNVAALGEERGHLIKGKNATRLKSLELLLREPVVFQRQSSMLAEQSDWFPLALDVEVEEFKV